MRHRGYFTREEREVRSRMTQIVSQRPFIRGSLVKMNRSCGKRNCWCAQEGKGHVSYYLAVRVGRVRKMIYIPQKAEKKIREWVGSYQQMNQGIAKITEKYIRQLRED